MLRCGAVLSRRVVFATNANANATTTTNVISNSSRCFSSTNDTIIPDTMKAAVVRKVVDADAFLVEFDYPPTELKPDQVLVKNEYSGINFIDTYHRSGLYSRELPFVGGQGGGANNNTQAAALIEATSSKNNHVPSSSPFSNTGSVRYLTSPAYRRYLKKQSEDLKPTNPTHEHGIQTPSLEVAKSMPNGCSEMENESLLVIAEMGNHKARCEVLRRHIMKVDTVDYEEAGKTLEEIEKKNRDDIIWAILPYKIGIAVAMISGIGAIPMVFNIDVALWFNHHFVTMEIPEPSDLDTSLETGAWTWNWMEPVLGTASFTLLAFQFSREQIKNLGLKPYTQQLQSIRAKALIKEFPQYDANILHDFVETDRLIKKF